MRRGFLALVAALVAMLIVGKSVAQAAGDNYAGALLSSGDTGGGLSVAVDPTAGPPITLPTPQ